MARCTRYRDDNPALCRRVGSSPVPIIRVSPISLILGVVKCPPPTPIQRGDEYRDSQTDSCLESPPVFILRGGKMHEAMDRMSVRRHTAIELALDVLAPGDRTLDDVLETAKRIDDFLRGK